MLEILITMVIVATALLGTAGLQAYAMKTNMGGQYRNQAVFLLNDITERMEANSIDAVGQPGYATAGAAVAAKQCNDQVSLCSPAELRAFDLGVWQAAVAAQLPQGVGVITQNGNGVASTNQPATYNVQITWVDRATEQSTAGSAVANGGTGENFSLTTTKVISY